MKEKEIKEILVKTGVKRQIQRLTGYSQPTIRAALRFQRNTAVARKIRKMALELGGAELINVNHENNIKL